MEASLNASLELQRRESMKLEQNTSGQASRQSSRQASRLENLSKTIRERRSLFAPQNVRKGDAQKWTFQVQDSSRSCSWLNQLQLGTRFLCTEVQNCPQQMNRLPSWRSDFKPQAPSHNGTNTNIELTIRLEQGRPQLRHQNHISFRSVKRIQNKLFYLLVLAMTIFPFLVQVDERVQSLQSRRFEAGPGLASDAKPIWHKNSELTGTRNYIILLLKSQKGKSRAPASRDHEIRAKYFGQASRPIWAKQYWGGPFLRACFFLRFEVQKGLLLCHIVLLQFP